MSPGTARYDQGMGHAEPEPARLVRVEEIGGEAALVATGHIDAGGLILVAAGIMLHAPTRTSVQQGPGRHHDVPPGTDADTRSRVYPWFALNHSCEPNAYWVLDDLRAHRAIEAGDLVTFDYETTEDELSTPFRCACNSPACRREVVRGYRFLSHEERVRRQPYLRPDFREALRLGE